jgi:predicted CXXCH cytochrome family protein
MMRIHRLYLYLLISLLPVLPCSAPGAAETGKQPAVNPHWTGKHCEECHLDKNPRRGNARLQFGGDPIRLCNRCHTRAFVTMEIHPINVTVDTEMQRIFPTAWPLNNGTLSCLTCHDALAQMEDNFPAKWVNPNFLRGAPYKKKTDFCFVCHPKKQFQKTNPHKQLDERGEIISQNCLVCHASVPDPARKTGAGAVMLKEPVASICVGCHPVHFASHGADRGFVQVPADMRRGLESREKALHVELPLLNDGIFCGTCHNPHEKGVIRTAAVQSGAGDKYFLRLNGGYDLCVICHDEKLVKDRRRHAQQLLQESFKLPPGVLIPHKPFAENKCKACHEITPQHREKPDAVYLCFRQGCHKPELLEKPYLHNKQVVGNCYACHESHASGYGKLLRVNEEAECYSCHPLFKDKNTKDVPEIEKDRSNKEHREFAAYLKTSAVPEGNDCGFCHNKKHRANITTMARDACSGCHRYVRGILQANAARPLNVHQSFSEKPCSKCHDPHAGPYQYQLKKPREAYLQAR